MSTAPFNDRLPDFLVYRAVSAALEEDLGLAGDITTDATVGAEATGQADLIARQAGVVAGLQLAEAAFKSFDHDFAFDAKMRDGAPVEAGDTVVALSGKARALLTGERVALNYLGQLSGIATLTNAYVRAIEGTSARICCTRKTTPGLRMLQKYAVRAGGGTNHRFGLYDAVLIKDNHIAAAGGVTAAVEAARARIGHMVKLEIEVESLDQLEQALQLPVDAVLLDNMDIVMLAEAVTMADGRVLTEASGGVSLETVRGIAETGVDLISVGALTHSAPALDVAVEYRVPR